MQGCIGIEVIHCKFVLEKFQLLTVWRGKRAPYNLILKVLNVSLAFYSLVVLLLKWLCQEKETHVVKNESVSFGAVSKGGRTCYFQPQRPTRVEPQWGSPRTVHGNSPNLQWLGNQGALVGLKGDLSVAQLTSRRYHAKALSPCRPSLLPILWETALDGKTDSYFP